MYNVKPMLSKGVFQKLKDKHIFIETCTVLNYTLAWDIGGNSDKSSCIDIDPETIYNEK